MACRLDGSSDTSYEANPGDAFACRVGLGACRSPTELQYEWQESVTAPRQLSLVNV